MVRRADREIKDATAIRAIMEEALVCRIGLSDDGTPYVVPMNYGLGESCLYLHCAAEGRKLDILRRNDKVCFEMDLMREIKPGAEPCGWGALYESVIGFGRAVILEAPAEKRAALDRIMEHCGAKGPFSYPDETLARTAVIRIGIESVTAKRRG
jgi:nitroimidazol reductase NimA-like FMN-containing flavoprotein (pyridoxamine 5'-phosphate oxidase superfamily)